MQPWSLKPFAVMKAKHFFPLFAFCLLVSLSQRIIFTHNHHDYLLHKRGDSHRIILPATSPSLNIVYSISLASKTLIAFCARVT